jgi:hypothetical protein
MAPGYIIQRSLTLALGCIGLAWAIFVLPSSEAVDDYRYLEDQLLRSESYSLQTLALKVADPSAPVMSDCDTHSQTALLLMEMRLAQAALRAGETAEFDQRSASIELRTKRVLGCAPRQSFVWLVGFSLEIMHGRLNDRSIGRLAMSYETSSNEGWISVRRNSIALPLVLQVPTRLQTRILSEFGQLIHNGFVDEAAVSYSSASEPIRSLLGEGIEHLEAPKQKAFWNAVQQRSP